MVNHSTIILTLRVSSPGPFVTARKETHQAHDGAHHHAGGALCKHPPGLPRPCRPLFLYTKGKKTTAYPSPKDCGIRSETPRTTTTKCETAKHGKDSKDAVRVLGSWGAARGAVQQVTKVGNGRRQTPGDMHHAHQYVLRLWIAYNGALRYDTPSTCAQINRNVQERSLRSTTQFKWQLRNCTQARPENVNKQNPFVVTDTRQ